MAHQSLGSSKLNSSKPRCQSLLQEEGLTRREERGELQRLLLHRNSVKSLKAAFTNFCPRSTVTRGPRPLGTRYCPSPADHELVQSRGFMLKIHWINNQKEPWLLDHTALKPRGGNQTTVSSLHCHSVGVGVPHWDPCSLWGHQKSLWVTYLKGDHTQPEVPKLYFPEESPQILLSHFSPLGRVKGSGHMAESCGCGPSAGGWQRAQGPC